MNRLAALHRHWCGIECAHLLLDLRDFVGVEHLLQIRLCLLGAGIEDFRFDRQQLCLLHGKFVQAHGQ